MTDWWQPTFQTTIDAFYGGDLAGGRDACERLLSLEELPPDIERQTRRNLVFYAPLLAELAPSATRQPIDIPVPDGWSRFNPSIATDPEHDGFRLIVRSSNYSMSRQLRYTIHDAGDIIRTTNYLVELAPDLDIGGVQAIDDRALRVEPPPFPVAGFEDCRLFRHGGAWRVSATVRDRNDRGICQIAMLQLDEATAVDLVLLSDGASRHEKNWMPAPDASAGTLQFVYSCFPTVVVRYDDEAGTVAPGIIQPAPPIARRFSGGTQAIPSDGGWLCMVHEAANFDDGGRTYTHRWVWFDPEWRLARLSPPFLLHERGIEFAAGLARRGDALVISYGVWDREAWLATVSEAEVIALLAPPLDPDEVEAAMRASAGAPSPMAAAPDHAVPVESAILDAEFVPIQAETPWADDGITPFKRESPTIVSMTLAGASGAIIGAALRSVVDWVDWLLVIDTGVTDDTLDIAREIAGSKLVVRRFPWNDDFSAARNFALEAAAELGADWAMTLDTDERIDPGQTDVRAALDAEPFDALHVKHVGGTYGKERFFRLPARGRYVGPTHEAYISAGGNAAKSLEGIVFDELPKSPQQYRHKAERDVAILSRHTAEHPEDPRWFYYLGDSFAGLGRNEEAIAAFRACAGLNGWDEEGAWAMYRAAESLLKLDRPVEAIEACAIGMAKHPGLGELPWLAAYAAWQAGKPNQAVHWARTSIILGQFMGNGAQVPRIGFRHPPALWEGPFDVLRYALRAVGDDAGADEAERVFEEAKAAREAR